LITSFPDRVRRSALRQLQLDATVASERLVGALGIQRLELAEPGSNKTLRRDSFADQVLNDGDSAR
jgi:hypothetical protein